MRAYKWLKNRQTTCRPTVKGSTVRIKSRTFSIIWKLILLGFGTFGLLDGAGLLKGAFDPGFPHMFTNVSNIFAIDRVLGRIAKNKTT